MATRLGRYGPSRGETAAATARSCRPYGYAPRLTRLVSGPSRPQAAAGAACFHGLRGQPLDGADVCGWARGRRRAGRRSPPCASCAGPQARDRPVLGAVRTRASGSQALHVQRSRAPAKGLPCPLCSWSEPRRASGRDHRRRRRPRGPVGLPTAADGRRLPRQREGGWGGAACARAGVCVHLARTRAAQSELRLRAAAGGAGCAHAAAPPHRSSLPAACI
jgi:hypothetical protein